MTTLIVDSRLPRISVADWGYLAEPEVKGDAPEGCGPALRDVTVAMIGAIAHFRYPISTRFEDLTSRFSTLAAEWKDATRLSSSPTEIAMHPSYQSIIGMGESVLPLILNDLKQTRDHWFWALRAITGANPVPPSDRGNVDAMIRAWLQWGRDRGLI